MYTRCVAECLRCVLVKRSTPLNSTRTCASGHAYVCRLRGQRFKPLSSLVLSRFSGRHRFWPQGRSARWCCLQHRPKADTHNQVQACTRRICTGVCIHNVMWAIRDGQICNGQFTYGQFIIHSLKLMNRHSGSP